MAQAAESVWTPHQRVRTSFQRLNIPLVADGNRFAPATFKIAQPITTRITCGCEAQVLGSLYHPDISAMDGVEEGPAEAGSAFEEEDPFDSLEAVLRDVPDWKSLTADLPPNIRTRRT